MRRVIDAIHYDVFHDGDEWQLHWSGDPEPFGWIYVDDEGFANFEPDGDNWSMNLDELAELAGLLRLHEANALAFDRRFSDTRWG